MKKKKFGSRKGQGSVEYILIIAVVVGVVLAFGKQFTTGLQSVTGKMFDGAGKNVDCLTKGGC
jgi:Flp pilus assembly pilin Flp